MTVEIPSSLEKELQDLAGANGKNERTIIEEAVRQYLDGLSITDLASTEIAKSQEALLGELNIPDWTSREPDGNGTS